MIRNKNLRKKNDRLRISRFLLFEVFVRGLFPTISVQSVNVYRRHKVLVEGLISQSCPEALIDKHNFLKVRSNQEMNVLRLID